MDYDSIALDKHKQFQGKIAIQLKDNLNSKDQLSTYYTPGVAAVSRHIHQHPDQARSYTWLGNNVAVISDGSAVLGLGNIGPLAALPVMEGKAMLFKHFANIDAIPIVLSVHSIPDIVNTVKAIAPSFGAINLEDIAAPQCFEIEQALISALDIPVMHDDQHGTAVVTLAGLINATKLTHRTLQTSKIVICGAGAAGVAIAKLIYSFAHSNIIMVDSQAIISPYRKDLNPFKKELLTFTNPNLQVGSLSDALQDADIFIGVSKPAIVTTEMIKRMHPHQIIFAMSNPKPEIMPDEALKAGAAIVATGRSDFPNQVNNALAFPGIFRGALDNKVRRITNKHKIAAAKIIAKLVKKPGANNIIPSILDPELVPSIARVIT